MKQKKAITGDEARSSIGKRVTISGGISDKNGGGTKEAKEKG